MLDLESLQHQFEVNADEENAFFMAKYMKNHFIFYGIKQDQRRKITKEWLKTQGAFDLETAQESALAMWQMPQREFQYSAIEVLIHAKKAWDASLLETCEHLISHRSWWDTVDYISKDLVGAYWAKHPEIMPETSANWLASGNMWLQRTAIISQRSFKAKTDEALLFANIRACMDSKEFFLQKAIGWALRDYARTHPESVLEFVQSHPLKPLSKREALKHFGLK
jgi:3-methyladenine DNA glycosylase AlkD